MSNNKLIIFAPFWNNIDWVHAALNHINYWEPDELYLCHGCWDKKFPPGSTDGTYEVLKEYQETHDNVWIVDNIRDGEYRENQRNTCNLILRLSNAQPNDWIMYAASDLYFFKNAIDKYKVMMKEIDFDYPKWDIYNFWDSIEKYYLHRTEQQMNLPHRIKKGTHFTGTCHIALNGKQYHQHSDCERFQVPCVGMHYEGIHTKERLKQKYDVGDRQSPTVWNNGIKLKKRHKYTGAHPEFAIPVLKEKFFYEEE